jgi:hypothetical protein
MNWARTLTGVGWKGFGGFAVDSMFNIVFVCSFQDDVTPTAAGRHDDRSGIQIASIADSTVNGFVIKMHTNSETDRCSKQRQLVTRMAIVPNIGRTLGRDPGV